MKKATIAAILTIYLVTMFVLPPILLDVKAIDVAITSVTPISGKVGDSVRVIGTTNKTSGLYQIWFGNRMVKEENATGNTVNTTISVPTFPKGNYNVTLRDVDMNINATFQTLFSINPAYYISVNKASIPPPEQFQEGETVEIWVNVTGGESNTVYTANITVSVPAPANEIYWTLAMLTNTTNTGDSYNVTVVYPNNFHGTPHTNYTGAYTVAFNKTLDTDAFTVGLSDRTEYHRNQLVDVKAVGYKPNENVTIKVSYGSEIIEPRVNVSATVGGLIVANWPVPSNASRGTYTLNITSTSPNATIKNPPDVQSFTVPGFSIDVTTKSRAGIIVPDVTVQVFENGKSIANATSNSTGMLAPQLKLEVGNYTTKAFYKNEKVAEPWINVTQATSLDYYCDLTSLKVSVFARSEGTELPVPEVRIYLTPENVTFFTNTTGIAVANLLLPNHTYVLNVSRYDVSFNVTSIPQLLVNGSIVAWYNVTFICPTSTLQVSTRNADNEPIGDALIIVQELMGGLRYERNTTPEGIAVFSGAFGMYRIEVFDADGIKLNETTVSLFQNETISIVCKLYGLAVSFRVVDYFGQSILNADVTLRRENLAYRSNRTQANGLATFNRITGGNLQVSVYLFNQTQPDMADAFYIENSTTIEIKLNEYVILAGFLVKTAYMATAIIIVATVLLALVIEVYRRKRSKPPKAQKQS